MNILGITLISLAVSSVFLYRLRQLDPKRRRIHKLAKMTQDKERTRLLWLLVFSPALPLLIGKLFSALIMWFAGLFLLGWMMAVIKPK